MVDVYDYDENGDVFSKETWRWFNRPDGREKISTLSWEDEHNEDYIKYKSPLEIKRTVRFSDESLVTEQLVDFLKKWLDFYNCVHEQSLSTHATKTHAWKYWETLLGELRKIKMNTLKSHENLVEELKPQ